MSAIVSVSTAVCLVMLLAAAALCAARAVSPTSVPNRLVALDLLLVTIVLGIGVLVFRMRSGLFLDVLVVVSLLGFVGTVTVARFVERRGA